MIDLHYHLLPGIDDGARTLIEVPFLGEMDGYRILLLEFPHGHITHGAENLIQKLLDNKVRPIIAHPERNKDVVRDLAKIEPFVYKRPLAIIGDNYVGPS